MNNDIYKEHQFWMAHPHLSFVYDKWWDWDARLKIKDFYFHLTVLDLPKLWPFLPHFSRPNWRVIFKVFQSNFDFAWLNSPVRSLVWENEWKNWEMLTSSLRSHNLKSDNISGKIRHCDNLPSLTWCFSNASVCVLYYYTCYRCWDGLLLMTMQS